jgi:hypothetical protein
MNKKNWIIAIAVIVIVIVGIVIVNKDTNVATAPEVVTNTTSIIATTTQSAGSTSSSSLTITQTGFYENKLFSLSYPSSWTISSYSPFSLTNFKGEYVDKDIIPDGGAEVDVVTTVAASSVKDIMTTELMSSTDLATTNVTVDHVACMEATYNNTYTSSIASKDVAVYCQQGTNVWKIYLSYRANDSAGVAHLTDFNSMLDSMKLL